MSHYTFSLLNPAKGADDPENAARLGALALGLEVTVEGLVAHCGLGNIDPQHGLGETGLIAAIEAALDWPLPPKGASLVTVKADADALGAMAVLMLRARGCPLSPDMRTRISEIARWDKLCRGSWQAWRRFHPPVFRPAMAVDLGGKSLEIQALDALVRLQSWTVAQRVHAMGEWLMHGKSSLPEEAVQAALAFESRLLEAWNRGDIDARAAANPCIAIMTAAPSAPLGGLDMAYRLAPVVIATGQMPWGRKLTIAQFEPGWVNMRAVAADLNALEPGWGGQPDSIIGSPQGSACELELARVQEVVEQNLLRPLAESIDHECK